MTESIRKIIAPSEERLITTQKNVLQKLKTIFLKQPPNSTSIHDRVFAVVGERGSGKSTILALLDAMLQGRYRTTGLIDAANVPQDLGLMAAAIEALWWSYKGSVNSQGTEVNSPNRDDYSRQYGLPQGDLETQYRRCNKLALASEKSYQELARDMAMSPEQYTNMVHDWSLKLKNFAPEFAAFARSLRHAFPKGTANDLVPDLVVFLDDLDLAEPETIRNWARSFMKNIGHLPVFWVLSYDRARLVAALSDRSLNSREERDLGTGEALLSKIVPFHQQFELNPWTDHDKMEFLPFSSHISNDSEKDSENTTPQKKGRLSLNKLIEESNCQEFIPLLPNFPRGLESIYSWLEDNQVGLSKTDGKDSRAGEPESLDQSDTTSGNLMPTSILKKFANANGVTRLSEYLKNMQAERIAPEFTWSGTSINDYSWSAMIQAANRNDVLRGLPVPEQLKDLVGSKRPLGHVETLTNIALKSRSIMPYQLLHELPFTMVRLEKCHASLPFSERLIRKSFNESRQQMTLSLAWGNWENVYDHDRDYNQWTLNFGPTRLIDFLCEYRPLEPVEMFKQLYLNDERQARCLVDVQSKMQGELGEKADRLPLLPRNLRGLLLLVDSLARAPWGELAAIRNFWGPISVTQCAASFFLSGLAFSIWLNETIKKAIMKQPIEKVSSDRKRKATDASEIPLLFFPVESFSVVRQFGEQEINWGYIRLVEALTDLIQNEPAYIGENPKFASGMPKPSDAIKDHPFKALEMTAREELRRMLADILKLSVVTQLRLPDKNQ